MVRVKNVRSAEVAGIEPDAIAEVDESQPVIKMLMDAGFLVEESMLVPSANDLVISREQMAELQTQLRGLDDDLKGYKFALEVARSDLSAARQSFNQVVEERDAARRDSADMNVLSERIHSLEADLEKATAPVVGAASADPGAAVEVAPAAPAADVGSAASVPASNRRAGK